MATISSVISTVKSWVSNNLTKYLPLSGGKMTGNITYVHSGLSIGTNPSSAQYKAIHWTDNTGDSGNNNRLATVEYSCSTDGTAGLTVGPYQYIANRASYNGSMLQMKITSGNTKSITWDGKPVVCVTKWTSGTSWYRVYSDGWIEQGGYFNCSANGTKVTFHKAFSNTNYYLNGNASQTTAGARFTSFYNRTTTNAACYTGDDSSFNAGYVYWYASGY